MSTDAPQFSRRIDARGIVVECVWRGQVGAARVFSAGEQDARDRALKQAEEKAARGSAQ